MSSVHAFLLNWLIFLCSTINTPLVTSITGQIKNIVTTLLSFVLFGGIAIGWDGILGLLLSTVASLWYAYIKFKQSASKQPQPLLNAASPVPLAAFAHPVGEKLL